MDSARLRHRVVAIVAAYAVVLHALLTAAMPVGPAAFAGPLTVLCGHGDDGSGLPAGDDPPCAAMCAALGQSLAGPPPPSIVAAIARHEVVVALAPPADWLPPRPMFKGPQAPRGPPRA